MRAFHKLTTQRALKYPKQLLFVDTETTTISDDDDSHEPSLRVGVAQYVRLNNDLSHAEIVEHVFKKVPHFWGFLTDLCNRTTDLTVFAHNWSFDFPVLNGFNTMMSLGYELRGIVDASPPVIIRYQRAQSRVTFIDSLNYFQQSLKSMGMVLGKHKIGINLTTSDIDELTTYCRQDVEIVRDSIINLMRFLHTNDLTRLTHTVSSLALSTFVRRFMKTEIFIDGDEARNKLCRKSYFGGRTECFRIGKYKGPFYLIDINSQYPFVMRNNDYPTKTFARHTRINTNDLESVIGRYCLTLKCDVNTHIPCLPYKIDGRTCFPVGRFTTVLSTPEIEYALDNGLIVKTHELVLHYRARIFEDYVDHFYNLRNQYRDAGNTMYAELAIKLLNTLYGKFGQQLNKWEETNEPPRGYPGKWFVFDGETRKRVYMMEIGGKIYRSVSEEESRDSYPAIAAHVTAHGRIMLQRTIDYIGREHCYYCDTDSLLIDQSGYESMKDRLNPRVLGCWSLDGEYNQIEIRGPKDYTFGSKQRIKGVRPKHVLVRDGLYRQLQFSTLRGSIRRGEITTSVIRHVEKRLKRTYKKGNVDHNGVVSPFTVGDDTT